MTYGFVRRTLTFLAIISGLVTAAIGSGCLTDPSLEDGVDEESLEGEGSGDERAYAVQAEGEEVGSADMALSGATCLRAQAGKYCGNDMIQNGAANTLYHCPGGQGAAASVVEVCQAGCHVSPQGVNDYCEASSGSCQSPGNCNNCVFFARCKKPNLPHGLSTYQNKVAIINSYTPQAGAVAVINTGDSVGHVAYVESVNGSTLTISEGNWPLGSCGQRTGTKESLRITGFFM